MLAQRVGNWREKELTPRHPQEACYKSSETDWVGWTVSSRTQQMRLQSGVSTVTLGSVSAVSPGVFGGERSAQVTSFNLFFLQTREQGERRGSALPWKQKTEQECDRHGYLYLSTRGPVSEHSPLFPVVNSVMKFSKWYFKTTAASWRVCKLMSHNNKNKDIVTSDEFKCDSKPGAERED